ncbi:MAG: hypothetical protein A2W61_06790 [Deltaproteobacteria bacterium RIFCSPLOWO2_01_44_7]|nr:MAG: hypothetical protein A2712_00965 [Deltaproteobacteria bacterium RIFCSPHIGHO2_01_FULL_43_49]OGQ15291.1 MAG: hypothetical protein A3D22_04510 [Deltaproteobacteria bacterium RIFCSPHIGHO2_02_FULL_44_53]OGQ27085.1 MAG: hypothetical protein A3D98_01555 [Deltaproteobacteria bacterium RIFCSPHIGHO2_12_FULL_44_21]OGQ31807.1 MAG: hypothetical protein A2979_05670 [Deltaproteobacteria bacterium RIFCSPLOWO2_01_FULL_45_74]OGQ39760.1 MAG: hypothetical protein A2W61_06790 [Deltaproteobacteria bacterium 
MQRGRILFSTLAGCIALLHIAANSYAETKLFGFKTDGELSAGGRAYLEELPYQFEKAKLEEYRDLRQQFFLDKFRLGLESEDKPTLFEIGGSLAGQRDQNFFLKTTQLGTYNFEFEWDQMPHLYSTSGQMLGTTISPGVYTLASPRPTGAQFNAAPFIDRIAAQWNTARFQISYQPSDEWDLSWKYNWIMKGGERPLGMAFGTPGSNFREVLEPVEHDIHDFQFTSRYAKEKYQLQFNYNLSLFENSLNSVTSDNPASATDGAFAATATGGSSTPSRGRTALAPDNVAHTWSLAGSIQLPHKTRINSSFSYSWRIQNQIFIPHTINPNIPTANLTLPQSALEGEVGVLSYNFNLTSKPLDKLTLTTKYRFYRFDDDSSTIIFPAYVEDDRVLVNGNLTAERYSFDKHKASFDARWQLLKPLALTAGMDWERWDRGSHREARETDEYTPRISLDLKPSHRVLFRATYSPSIKVIDNYIPQSSLQHVSLRKFDETSRQRHKVDFFTQLTPWDNLSTSINFNYKNDDYQDSTFGLQDSESWSVGTDLSWSPTDRLTLFGNYTREEYFSKQASRSRATGILENTAYDWVAKTKDIIDTARVGFDIALIRNKLNLSANWDISRQSTKMDAFNPQTPTGGTAAQNTTATANDFPAIKSTLNRFESYLKYRFGKAWTAKFAYLLEDFDRDDFRTDGLVPTTGSDIVLGSAPLDYTAHIVVATLGYQF